MLKVNVGLSRKLSRDFNSTGFSLNLEGEICVGPEDPETLIEKIKEYFDLAEEALSQQIERYEGESAIARRDESPAARPAANSPRSNGRSAHEKPASEPEKSNDRSHQGNESTSNSDAATNKQVQYLLNLGKRQGLTTPQLEGRITELLGSKVGLYDLSKRQAGEVIDVLSNNAMPAISGNGRSRART